MRLEQYVWKNGCFHFFRRTMCKAWLRVGANICIGPAVEGAFFDTCNVIGRKIVAKPIALLNPRVEFSSRWVESEGGRIAHSRGKRGLAGAVCLEALNRGFDLWLHADVASGPDSYKHSSGFWI